MNRQSMAVGLLSTICCLPTYAANQNLTVADLLEVPLEELMQVKIVSEVTGCKQTVSKAPAIVKVITAEDIKKLLLPDNSNESREWSNWSRPRGGWEKICVICVICVICGSNLVGGA